MNVRILFLSLVPFATIGHYRKGISEIILSTFTAWNLPSSQLLELPSRSNASLVHFVVKIRQIFRNTLKPANTMEIARAELFTVLRKWIHVNSIRQDDMVIDKVKMFFCVQYILFNNVWFWIAYWMLVNKPWSRNLTHNKSNLYSTKRRLASGKYFLDERKTSGGAHSLLAIGCVQ